ncbi:MAG: hypothetical protein HY816_20230 [Candidatus Wallbacteria bacterium]|nr:hypothetical protein [Candidatus Wallbacteria bacterium]
MSSNGTSPINDTSLPARGTVGSLVDAEVFVRRTCSGEIKAVTVSVPLREKLKHFYAIPGRKDEPPTYALQADGYYTLNRALGLQIVTPEELSFEGQTLRNPYIRRTAEGTILEVIVRKLCVGRAPLGNTCVTDSTLCFVPRAYLFRDIIKKMKGYYSKKEGGWVQNLNICKIKPQSMISDEERKTRWIIDQGMGLSLVINVEDKDFLSIFANFNEMQIFAERRAQTVCERMAMSRHPAIAQKVVLPAGEEGDMQAKVIVVAWQENDKSREELRQRALSVARGERTDETTVISATFTAEEDEPETFDTPETTNRTSPPGGRETPGAPAETADPAADATAQQTPSPAEPPAPRRTKKTAPPVEPPAAAAPPTSTPASTPAASTSAPAPDSALSAKERADLIDEVEMAADAMDEGDYIAVFKTAGAAGKPISTLSDSTLQRVAEGLRKKVRK